MKIFFQKLFSIKNKNNYKKVITIAGIKITFFSINNAIKDVLLKLNKLEKKESKIKALENNIQALNCKVNELTTLQKFYMTEKPWKNLKVYMSDISAKESAKFIIKNMHNVPSFSGRFKMYEHILKNHNKEGLYLEFGVHVGNSINAIARIKSDKIIYGFDSFKGLPENWITDYPKGHFKMNTMPEVNSNVVLIEGYFEDSLPEFIKEHGNFDISFINIDCDLYSSTKTIFDNLKGHISQGTIICFDDFFNYPNWQQHEYKAFMEFLDETGFDVEYLGYVYLNTKVALKIK